MFCNVDTGYFSSAPKQPNLIENTWAGLTSSGATSCIIGLATNRSSIVVFHDDSTDPEKQLEILNKKDIISTSSQSKLILCYNPLFHSDQKIRQWDNTLKQKFRDMTITWKQITNFDSVGLTVTGTPVLIQNRLAVYSSGKCCERFIKYLLPGISLTLDHQTIPMNPPCYDENPEWKILTGTPIEKLNKNGECHNKMASILELIHHFALACSGKLPR